MKYFIIAGERSGDLHGANLIKSIKQCDSSAEIMGYGGDMMAASGAEILVHYRELAYMGFLEVVKNLHSIRKLLSGCKTDIKQYQPDTVVLIDFGGFNMKIARYAKSLGIAVHYYITPKVWAWNQRRAYNIKKYTDYRYVILPFEADFFKKFNCAVDYVGNPVLDAVKSHEVNIPQLFKNYVALLPGSRVQEVKAAVKVFGDLAKQHSDLNFAVAKVDNLDDKCYSQMNALSNVKLFTGSSYDLLAGAEAAIVTSGTATLETALWKIPQVVVYRTSRISYAIAKRLIKVKYISLVNLVANKEVVRELIQENFNVQMLSLELKNLLTNIPYRKKMLDEYETIYQTLDIGSASDNTAQLICARTKKAM